MSFLPSVQDSCGNTAATATAVRNLHAQPEQKAPPVRVFVGLKLAVEIARQLTELARPLEPHGVRLVSISDMHLTLVPPWNEINTADAAERVRNAVDGVAEFPLTIIRLQYGPMPKRPHLLWAECSVNDALTELHVLLLTAFGGVNLRPFRPHVTVARFRNAERILVRKVPIDLQLSLTQRVASVELFQSPSKEQSGYKILASATLRAQPNREPT